MGGLSERGLTSGVCEAMEDFCGFTSVVSDAFRISFVLSESDLVPLIYVSG